MEETEMAFTTTDLTPDQLTAQLQAAGLTPTDISHLTSLLTPEADGLIPTETATTAGAIPEVLAPDGDPPQVLDITASGPSTVSQSPAPGTPFAALAAIVEGGSHQDLTVGGVVNGNFANSVDVWAGGGDGNSATVSMAFGTLYGGSGNDQNLTLFTLGHGTLIEGSGNHQTATIGGGRTSSEEAIGGSGSGDVLNAIGLHDVLIGGTGNNQTLNGADVTMGSGNNDVANVGGGPLLHGYVTGGSGNNDVINVSGFPVTATMGTGNNQTINTQGIGPGGNTFVGGSGANDHLNITQESSLISDGGGVNQHIVASGGGSTLNLTPGKHEQVNLASSGHNVVNVAASSGNVTISGVTSTDVINEATGAHVVIHGVDPGIHYI
jgi:hypothetical protein